MAEIPQIQHKTLSLSLILILNIAMIKKDFDSFPGAMNITFKYSECTEDPESFADQGNGWTYINTACNCVVTLHFNGTLTLNSKICKKSYIEIVNSTGLLINTLCKNFTTAKVYRDNNLFLDFHSINGNIPSGHSEKPYHNVSIYISGNSKYESF